MTKMNSIFPIDIVYLWVDSRDAKFNSEKNKYLKESKKDTNKYVDDVRDEIFRDNYELKYSLR